MANNKPIKTPYKDKTPDVDEHPPKTNYDDYSEIGGAHDSGGVTGKVVTTLDLAGKSYEGISAPGIFNRDGSYRTTYNPSIDKPDHKHYRGEDFFDHPDCPNDCSF